MRPYRPLILVLFCTFLATMPGTAIPIAASTPILSLSVPAAPQPGDGTIDVEVHIQQASNLGAWEFDLAYDPALVTLVGLTAAPAFGAPENCQPESQRCAFTLGPQAGRSGAAVGAVSYGSAPGLHGDAVMAVLHFRPTGVAGTTPLSLVNALVTDVQANPVTPVVQEASLSLAATGHQIFLPSVTNQAAGR